MEKMDVDESVVDLSLGRGSLTITPSTARDLRALTQNSGLTITPALPVRASSPPRTPSTEAPAASAGESTGRRVLRPRTEPKSYAEVPDIVLLPAKVNGKQQNGSALSDDDEEMPSTFPIKELTAAEIWERERELRKLREELRCEETKLVLLKKLKQSQQMMKENLVTQTPSNLNPLAGLPASLTKGSLSVTATNAVPLPAHSKNKVSTPLINPQLNITATKSRPVLPGGATLSPSMPGSRNSLNLSRTGSNLTITPSVTITPTSAPPKNRNIPTGNISNSVSITPAPSISCTSVDQKMKSGGRSNEREDAQTQAQRQAAAKLALRKQLEKTLLQIPPPKPPPPEMNFVPNPSNTEFVYLLGLEHVVDYLTKDKKPGPPQQPFRCAQCKIDFTPVWKWEKQGKKGNPTFHTYPAGKDPKVICETCVTSNVKKSLKAEHTNRLKTAFVKALQQEQEIEQRLASASTSSPSPDLHRPQSSTTPSVSQQTQNVQILPTKSQTPTPRPTPTPPSQPTPPPRNESRSNRQQQSQQQQFDAAALAQQLAFGGKFPADLGALGSLAGNLGNLGNLAGLGNLGNVNQAAAAIQQFQQQLFRGLQGLSGGNLANLSPAHMMQFSPLLYSYQLAMAQALAASGKAGSLSDIQRFAELQRQYLEMLPQSGQGSSSKSNNSRQNNWKS